MSNLNPGGLTRVLNYIKTWVTGLLNDKANSSHSHTKSQITDFPTIPSKTSQLTNDSGFLTAHQSLSNYSTLANTVKSLSISGKTITVTPGSGSAYTLTTQDTVYTHPTTAGNKHIPSGGSANQYLKYSESGTAVWANLPTIPSKTSQLTNDSGYITSSGSCNYANSAGSSGSSSTAAKLIGDDTRNNNYTPANYINSGQQATIRSEFKTRSTLGAPGDSQFGTSVTITPWRDNSGGRPVQLYFSDSYYTSAIRFATGDSSWSSWYQLNTEYLTKLNGYRIYVG